MQKSSRNSPKDSLVKKRFLDTLHGKIIFSILCVLLVAAGGVLIAGDALLSKMNHVALSSSKNKVAYVDVTSESSEAVNIQRNDAILGSSDVMNILLIGSDTRNTDTDGKYGNSDSMILLSVNKKTDKLKMISFLRDLYVPIKGFKKESRINASFLTGGPDLLIDTIETNFGIKIDQYVCIDFDGFEKAIDSVGGVNINLTKAEADELTINSGVYYCQVKGTPQHVTAGMNKLNGCTALGYARIRHIDNDFNRTQRQRNVINSFMSSMKNANPFTLMNVANTVFPLIKTDLTNDQILQLAVVRGPALMRGNAEQLTIPAEGAYHPWKTPEQEQVLVPDLKKSRKIVQDFLYND